MLIHPLVIHFPVALWLTSLLFDLMAWRREDAAHRRAAYWLVGLGLLGAAVSIVFGWVDLIAYERGGVEPAFVRRHWLHSLPAYAASVLYLGSFLWRWRTQNRLSGALVTLSVLAAMQHEHELAMHVKAALRNGLTPEQIGEVLLQVAVYAGVPVANRAFPVAQRALAEAQADDGSERA